MKKILSYFLYTLLLAAVACACNGSLDINQVYGFDLVTMPIPKKIIKDETIEIRCQIVKEGNYRDTKYYIRYFQTDGEGELRLDNGTLLTPNDLFQLKKDVFRLYYTSRSTDQQTIDVYIEDSFGQTIEKSFNFSNESVKESDK